MKTCRLCVFGDLCVLRVAIEMAITRNEDVSLWLKEIGEMKKDGKETFDNGDNLIYTGNALSYHMAKYCAAFQRKL